MHLLIFDTRVQETSFTTVNMLYIGSYPAEENILTKIQRQSYWIGARHSKKRGEQRWRMKNTYMVHESYQGDDLTKQGCTYIKGET